MSNTEHIRKLVQAIAYDVIHPAMMRGYDVTELSEEIANRVAVKLSTGDLISRVSDADRVRGVVMDALDALDETFGELSSASPPYHPFIDRVVKRLADPALPERCCERDYDGDGNCDRHPPRRWTLDDASQLARRGVDRGGAVAMPSPYDVTPIADNVLRFSHAKWQQDAVDYDLSICLRNVAVAGALCMSFNLGWFGRSCEATPGSFTQSEYWWPGCGRPYPSPLPHGYPTAT